LLIESGTDINCYDNNGLSTVLNRSISKGYTDIAKFLIEKGAGLNVQDKNGDTPLIKATKREDIDFVKFLIENGADVNLHNKEGKGPLKTAIEDDNIDIVKLFISKNADVNEKEIHGDTPLIGASRKGNLNIVKLLIENGAVVNTQDSNGITPLILATYKGFEDVVEILLDKGADVNARSNYGDSLMYAAEKGHFNIAKILISKGAKIDTDHVYPNGNSSSSFDKAITFKNYNIAELLINKLDKGDKIDKWFMYAVAFCDNVDIVKLLIDNGANWNRLTKKNKSALDLAIENGNNNIINLLEKLFFLISKEMGVDSLRKEKKETEGNIDKPKSLSDLGENKNCPKCGHKIPVAFKELADSQAIICNKCGYTDMPNWMKGT